MRELVFLGDAHHTKDASPFIGLLGKVIHEPHE